MKLALKLQVVVVISVVIKDIILHSILRKAIAFIDEENKRGVQNRGGKSRGNSSSTKKEVAEMSSEITFVALKKEMEESLSDDDIFIIDSGASNHMFKEEFVNKMFYVEKLDHIVIIHIANGDKMFASQKGKLKVSYQKKIINIEGLIVSGLKHNLLAISKLVARGHKVTFDENHMIIIGGSVF